MFKSLEEVSTFSLRKDEIEEMFKECETEAKIFFGNRLEDILARDDHKNEVVPIIVKRTLLYLYENALNEEGLFRIPGNSKHINEAAERYNEGDYFHFTQFNTSEIHLVASLLGKFLRGLPDPLLPQEAFPQVIDIIQQQKDDDQELLNLLQNCINGLKSEHYRLLVVLLCFLNRVSQNEDKNRMKPESLARVFCSIFFQPKENDPQTQLKHINDMIHATKCLIEEFPNIFPGINMENVFDEKSISEIMNKENSNHADNN